MTFHDVQGLALSGATAQAIDAFEQANHELRCLIGDPLASAQRAIELAPQMTLAHALAGWLNLLGTEPVGVDAARAALETARSLPADERETMHLQRPLRSRAHRFGGSHAQRDLIELTLIEAAARDGQKALADALRNERALLD